MNYASALSISTDAYRAGIEIGEALAPIAPDVVLLFASISFQPDFEELFDGITDVIDNPDLIVFGCTGDGVYSTARACNYAVSALGIASDDEVTWTTAYETGVGTDSRATARRAMTRALEGAGGRADFCLVLADGSTADGTAIVDELRALVEIPLVGGLAGDDRRFLTSRIFYRGQELQDAVAILLATGPLQWAATTTSGWIPTGAPGTIEAADGCTLQQIEGQRPWDFMTTQLGKPIGEMDLGTTPFAAFDDTLEGPFFLRTTSKIGDDGSLTTFGSIPPGTQVRVCTATREDVLGGVASAVESLLAGDLGFVPEAALVVSCAGRKWVLEDDGQKEISLLLERLGRSIPLVGFPSFGEIGPVQLGDGSDSRSYFHNVSFVLCLLGG